MYKVTGAPRNVNPARAITCLVEAQPSIVPFSITIHLPSPVFTQQNSFEKQNYLGKCSLNKSLNFNQGPGALWPDIYSYAGYFHEKTKTSTENLRLEYYLRLKYLTSHYLGQIAYKIQQPQNARF